MAVVGAEDALAADSLVGGFYWSSGNYWLAFFGEPVSAAQVATGTDSTPATAHREQPWGWQFGGHHLAINMSVVGQRTTLSPTFVGVEPARYATPAGTVAPLAEHRAAGLAIMNALDDMQRDQGWRRPPSSACRCISCAAPTVLQAASTRPEPIGRPSERYSA